MLFNLIYGLKPLKEDSTSYIYYEIVTNKYKCLSQSTNYEKSMKFWIHIESVTIRKIS